MPFVMRCKRRRIRLVILIGPSLARLVADPDSSAAADPKTPAGIESRRRIVH